ncbi:MAG: OmpA family protein [Nitrospina sp.]|jgi:chemotaxis protein MotB|nr:OmpA family protein [Nitrospina sp.]
MKNMESLQLIKEQLKIKSIELRKVNEEKGQVTKKIKDLITFNQGEVKKLKETIKKSEGDVAEQKSLVEAARLSKHAGVTADKKEREEEEAEVTKRLEAKMDEKMKGKMKDLASKIDALRERIEKEKGTNKKFERERDVLMKELKRLRQDTGTTDNLKKKIEGLKADLAKAKKTSMSSGAVTEDIVKEKDSLIKKYEDMLYGGMDAGEDGMLPAEIIQELKEEVEDLEKERRQMIVELEMLKEDNAEMDMKIVLLEEEKGRGGKGGGDSGDFRPVEGRSAQTSEFSGGLENFLITYSDMMTLILVVFVLMYSVSKLDENKFAEALSSFQTKRMRIESVNVRLSKAEMKMLERVRELVKDNVDAESLARSDTRTILHRLPTSDLFAPGEAFFNEGAEDLIIATIKEDMQEGVRQVLVDGHTDNVPMKSAKYPSNWELSAARASKVARFIIEKMRFPPEQIVVTGYGEFRPLKANTDDDARAANRRVEIKILKALEVAKDEAKKPKKTSGAQEKPGDPKKSADSSISVKSN